MRVRLNQAAVLVMSMVVVGTALAWTSPFDGANVTNAAQCASQPHRRACGVCCNAFISVLDPIRNSGCKALCPTNLVPAGSPQPF